MVKYITQYPVPGTRGGSFDCKKSGICPSTKLRALSLPRGNLESGIIAATIFILLTSCTGTHVRDETIINTIPAEIKQDLTVSGNIHIRGEVKVFPGATLTVKPGTRFLFEPYDPDEDGVNDSRLIIEGVLVARGDPDAPIYFSSAAADPEPGDWLELRMDHSEGSVLEYCVLEHSRYGLHVHFSSGMVANSVFRSNIDGTRFGNSQFDLLWNRFTGNSGKGINLRESVLFIYGNRIDDNRHGIFLFESAGKSDIVFNSFSDNELSDLRFGDFYQGEPPQMDYNYRSDGSAIKVMGYSGDDLYIRGNIDGTWKDDPDPYVFSYKVEELWTHDLGSFIDASPVVTGDKQKIIIPTWESGVRVLENGTGKVISRIDVPDVTDASPVLYSISQSGEMTGPAKRETMIFPSWDLKVRKADVISGDVIGEISWNPSPADDHRQATPLEVRIDKEDGPTFALGLWNGQFGMLNPESMEWEWQVQLDGAIRARSTEDRGSLWIGTDNGSLYRISMDGKIVNKVDLGAPIRTSPLVVEEGSVVVVTGAGILFRITGNEIKWRRQLQGPGTYASPYLLTGIVVGDGFGCLSLYSADGALKWQTNLGSPIHVITGTEESALFVVGTEDGSLYGFDMLGRPRLKIPSSGSVHGAVLYEEDDEQELYQLRWGSRDGKIRAVRIKTDYFVWEPPGP